MARLLNCWTTALLYVRPYIDITVTCRLLWHLIAVTQRVNWPTHAPVTSLNCECVDCTIDLSQSTVSIIKLFEVLNTFGSSWQHRMRSGITMYTISCNELQFWWSELAQRWWCVVTSSSTRRQASSFDVDSYTDEDDNESVPSASERQDLRQGAIVQRRVPRPHVDDLRARWRRRRRSGHQRALVELRPAPVRRRGGGRPDADRSSDRMWILRWHETDSVRERVANADDWRHDGVLDGTSHHLRVVAATSRSVLLDLSSRSFEATARRTALPRRRLLVGLGRWNHRDVSASATESRSQRVHTRKNAPAERTTSRSPSPSASYRFNAGYDNSGWRQQQPHEWRGRCDVFVVVVVKAVPDRLGTDQNASALCW